MTALTRVTRGENPANSDKLNQVIDAWNGNTAGVNQGNSPLSLTAINDALNYALAIKNADAAGKGLIIYAPDGVTPLLRVDKTNGVYASPDGTAAAAPISTTTGTQTLTNKTLTGPHMTTPVVDSGGLTITAGGLTVTAGGLRVAGGNVDLSGATVIANLPNYTAGPGSAAGLGTGVWTDLNTATITPATTGTYLVTAEAWVSCSGASTVNFGLASVPTGNGTTLVLNPASSATTTGSVTTYLATSGLVALTGGTSYRLQGYCNTASGQSAGRVTAVRIF